MKFSVQAAFFCVLTSPMTVAGEMNGKIIAFFSVQMVDFCHGTVRGTIWALETDKGGSLMNEQIRYGPGTVPRRNAKAKKRRMTIRYFTEEMREVLE